jgi:hypothetical protein
MVHVTNLTPGSEYTTQTYTMEQDDVRRTMNMYLNESSRHRRSSHGSYERKNRTLAGAFTIVHFNA